MSQSLRSMKSEDKKAAIARRLKQSENNRGLGYWGAVDASNKGKNEK